jgi:hypothetical protein
MHAGAPQRPAGARPVLPRWMSSQLKRSRARQRRRSSGTASVADGSPWWPLQGVAADHRAGQHRRGIEAFGGGLVPDPQPPPSAEPGPGPLDPPAVAAKPLGGPDRAAGGPRADATPAQVGTAAAMVVGLVGVDLGWPAAPAAGGYPDRRDVVQHRLEHGASPVLAAPTTSGSHRRRRPGAAWTRPAAIDGVCTGQVPPFGRTQAEGVHADPLQVDAASLAQLVQQLCLQPLEHARLGHSSRRRQQVVALLQPTRWRAAGSRACWWGHEDERSDAVAVRDAAWDPAAGRAGAGGSSGWMRCHSASGRSRSTRVLVAGSTPRPA